ncbi:hypothetical protein BTA51_28600 [Hahella sp. CCB-MM4]|uniref:hypothetical protein n=1 Tax=Hahella sp. (strain CCB-MM4) TaxID=1926491 RepID=UPI000B9B4457|nr:hypothetical protein [Hahella sp. CCB-MM4]OZG69943.1 hypothetical protein BTA51_28600 [Hahella sp. CCB-MM4]
MKVKEYEIRSEEEKIGNILLIESSKSYNSKDDAFEDLWIIAQEYSSSTDRSKMEADYKKEMVRFIMEQVDADSVTDRISEIIERFKNDNVAIKCMPEDAVHEIKGFLKKGFKQREIFVLEDDFDEYTIVSWEKYSSFMFSWNDII